MKMKNKVIPTKNMSHEEWLGHRRKGLGGSDASTIVGLNKYSSPYSLWADKMGILPPIQDNEAMRTGRDLEDYVAKRFTEATGKKVRNRNAIIIHNEYDYIFANIDREVVGENAGLECKTASALNMKTYKNGEFPDNYYVQCMHYMAVTGADRWYLAVLIMGREFKVFTIERDEEEIQALINAECNFWNNHILTNTPPEVDETEATKEALNNVFNDTNDEEIQLDELKTLADLTFMKRQKKELEEEIKGLENKIKEKMGNNNIDRCGRFKITWKPQRRITFDYKSLLAEHEEINASIYQKVSKSKTFKITEIEVQ